HTKGAFTGATTARAGLFRSAEGGTIFLDEIGEISQALQVRLLRAVQEHEVTPVGSSAPARFDARVVCATNRDLEREVSERRFRDAAGQAPAVRDPDGLRPTLAEIERRHILDTLASVNQDKARAANILGIDLSTLYRKLKRYDAV